MSLRDNTLHCPFRIKFRTYPKRKFAYLKKIIVVMSIHRKIIIFQYLFNLKKRKKQLTSKHFFFTIF